MKNIYTYLAILIAVFSSSLNVGFAQEDPAAAWMPDSILRKVVRRALELDADVELTQEALKGLTELNTHYRAFRDREDGFIADITGLEYATNLELLVLVPEAISDINPLAGLTKLTWLDITSNQISDISAVAGLVNLTALQLIGNPVADLSVITNLTKLTILNIPNSIMDDLNLLQEILRKNPNLTTVNFIFDIRNTIKTEITKIGFSEEAPQTYVEGDGVQVNVTFDTDGTRHANAQPYVVVYMGEQIPENERHAEWVSAEDTNSTEVTFIYEVLPGDDTSSVTIKPNSLTVPKGSFIVDNNGTFVYGGSTSSDQQSVVIIPTPEPQDVYVPIVGTLYPIIFSEFLFQSKDRLHSEPQWIEVYNRSTTDVNLRGWQLQLERHPDYPIINEQGEEPVLERTVKIQTDFVVPAREARLIATSSGQNSGGKALEFGQVYNLFDHHSVELNQNTDNKNSVIVADGFSLKLLDADNILIDMIGNLNEDGNTVWEIPKRLLNIRVSLIRRFDAGTPRPGTERRGWIPADKVKNPPKDIYYGHRSDIGAPGYRSKSNPLPVNLSVFTVNVVSGNIVIKWVTESELNNAGFYVLRNPARAGNYEVLNAKLIPGAGTIGERSSYMFTDMTAVPGVVYYYQLVDVSYSGVRTVLATQRLRGTLSPVGKRITQWGNLKNNK